jgi:hypothetical protein
MSSIAEFTLARASFTPRRARLVAVPAKLLSALVIWSASAAMSFFTVDTSFSRRS